MEKIIFYIIIGIIVAGYLVERILSWLNRRKISTKLPPELEDVYDSEQYSKQQQYKKDNEKLSYITSTLNTLLILAMIVFGGFAWLDVQVREFVDHPVWTALIFFGVLMFAADLIGMPFSVYDTFVIEEKYGFNKTTPRVFILDKLKGWMLSAIIGGGVFALIIWFYTVTREMFWIYAWIAVSFFMLFITMFYSTLIVPLFNKQTPLEEGELRNEIETFSKKAGFKLDNIFVIDGSKRSTKANAYFSGIGKKKRIVLFDTLINDLTNNEIVAVLAHEIGHYKKNHITLGMIASILQTGLTFFILSVFIAHPVLSEALGAEQHSFHLALIAFGILYTPLSIIMGLFMNKMSRYNENKADEFAGQKYKPEPLISALKKLSSKNLSNLTPHPAYVFFYYSHPPLLKRIRHLKKIGNRDYQHD